jgi:pilus assembly protein CpaE
MNARLALGLTDSDQAAQLIALAEEAGEVDVIATPETSDDVFTVLAQTEIEVLLLDEQLGPLPVHELARQLQAQHPSVGLLLLAAHEATPELLRQALRAGFRDVLSAPLTVEALADASGRAATWARAVRERSESDDLARVAEHVGGKIVAIAGAKGGVGCSTVALHVALAAARHDAERPVCLAELDLQAGDMRSLLDLQSHRSIADLAGVAEAREITARSLDDTLYVHSSGLRVLLAPERGEDGEDVNAATARQILGALKFQYDVVVCDVGTVMTEAGAVAVEMASNVLVVTTPDVPAIRAANRLLRLWERLQIDTPASILLNRTSREHEIQPDFARKVLQAPVLDTVVPSGFRELEEPLNTGHPERLEQGSIGRALAEVAVAVDAVPAETRRRRLRLRRAARAATGQTTVEMLVLLPLIILTVLAFMQMLVIGYTYMEAGHAARAGARAWAVDDSKDWWTAAAKGDLPKSLRDNTTVAELHDDSADENHNGAKDDDGKAVGVKVTVQVPEVVPLPSGIKDKLKIVDRKRTVAEE